ncbi:DUF1206 domain-containing protein [Microbacterium koreense]|uniref:DUF1206 domain-containing protein n=1 Tax=Microbacterium koreense TaxID=323761 RepID=A0ABW2ZTF0_9MICO
MTDHVQQAAQSAESSTALRTLARGGYVANGIVHVLLGILIIVVATGGEEETDQAGAFQALAEAPFGIVALWVCAVALAGLAVWLIVDGITVRQSGNEKRDVVRAWGRRLAAWGRAVVYGALGGLAASVALGARSQSGDSAESVSRELLSTPGGPFILGAVGVGIFGAGVGFVVIGVGRRFRKNLMLPSPPVGTAVVAIGAVGYVAKGIALAVVGILLIIAAVQIDPETAGGLDAAVASLLGLPYGPWIAGGIGCGLLAYGIYCFFRARYARL